MFGAGGSIQGMRDNLSNNKKLLKTKRYFKKERSFLNIKAEYLKSSYGKVDLNKANKEEILQIRNKIKSKLIKERILKDIIISFILIVFVSMISYFLFEFIKQEQKAIQQRTIQEKEKEYLRLIDKGDNWLKQAKWYNARFNYKKAREIFPNSYDINYRILNSYTLECEIDFNNCFEAKDLLEKLVSKYPEKETQLMQLKEKLNYEY